MRGTLHGNDFKILSLFRGRSQIRKSYNATVQYNKADIRIGFEQEKQTTREVIIEQCLVLNSTVFSGSKQTTRYTSRAYLLHGVGANKPTVAQVAMQVPRPTLHAMMAAGAPIMVTPKVKPAAA